MDYEKKISRMLTHLHEHPADYQTKIAMYKTMSDLREHNLYLRRIEKRKRIALAKRRHNEESKQH